MAKQELLLGTVDALLVDNETNIEYATATVKSHSIAQSVDTTEIRAGRKDVVIATIESNKSITVELEDAETKRDWVAIAMDAEITDETSIDVRVLPQQVVVGEGLKIKLDKAPKVGSEPIVIFGETQIEASFTGAAGTLTAGESGLQVGDVVDVMSYTTTATKAQVMQIGGEGVGRSFSLYLEESIFNGNMKVIATKITYFPRVIPQSSFTLEGTNELGEQNVTYTFNVAQADGYDYLGKVYYLDVV